MKATMKHNKFITALSLLTFLALLPSYSFSQGIPINGATSAIKSAQAIVDKQQEQRKEVEEKLGESLTESDEVLLKTAQDAAKDEISDLLLGNKADSLMFSEEEDKNIGRALESYNSNETYSLDDHEGSADEAISEAELLRIAEEERNKNAKSYVYLASLLYVRPNQWIMWLNDKKITSEDNNEDNEFYVTSAKKGQVDISWKIGLTKWRIISRAKPDDPAPKTNADNKVEVNFKLKPNQTFILTTKEVVEGRP